MRNKGFWAFDALRPKIFKPLGSSLPWEKNMRYDFEVDDKLETFQKDKKNLAEFLAGFTSYEPDDYSEVLKDTDYMVETRHKAYEGSFQGDLKLKIVEDAKYTDIAMGLVKRDVSRAFVNTVLDGKLKDQQEPLEEEHLQNGAEAECD